MGGMAMHAGGEMSMWMPGQTWPGIAASFLGMWMTMMVPMMIPPFAVMLWQYRGAAAMNGANRLGAASAMVALGYFFVWSTIGVVISPVVAAVSAITARLPISTAMRPIAIATTILIAGIVQLTPWKARLVAACRGVSAKARTPQTDVAIAWRDGISLGVHCAQSCAPLMALALVAGDMDLRVMAAVTTAITVERLAASDRGKGQIASYWISRPR